MTPTVTRHRLDTRRRTLTVRETRALTPGMLRITLEGPELADFQSLGADDHVKLFFGEAKRDYTPRAYSQADQSLVLDFALHEAGPATDWALKARRGDTLQIGGPRGSSQVTGFDWYLLIGDETALPAIGRRAEELSGATVLTLAAVTGAGEEQDFPATQRLWVHRPAEAADDPSALLAAFRGLTLPQGHGYIWIAAEAQVARALRDHALNGLGHKREWVKASGYWVKGVAEAHVKFED
jgi:NADPH-dependent ferric siderophore reductase